MYVAARVNQEKCNGCKLCVLTCPDPNVISIEIKKISVDQTRCKGCGLCVAACPREALAIS